LSDGSGKEKKLGEKWEETHLLGDDADSYSKNERVRKDCLPENQGRVKLQRYQNNRRTVE